MNTNENRQTSIRMPRNRRALAAIFFAMTLMLRATSSQSGEQPVPTAQPSASADESWTVTLSAPDGPHPSFVSNSRRLLSPPELLDAPDEWIDRSLRWVDYILRTYPPGIVELPQRRPALFRLDEVLHIESAPIKPLVHKFYQLRLQRAIEEIEQTKVTEGMRIWRLYNHGAFVRTPTASFTFDFVPGIDIEGFSLPKEWVKRLVAQSDAHFISHWHPDHANPDVVRMYMEAKKPVIAPEKLFRDDSVLSGYLTVPERSFHTSHSIPIREGKSRLEVVAFPGHQGTPVLNNVTLVRTTDGFTIVHTGDQSGDEKEHADWEWLPQVGHYYRVDVLLTNGWTNALHRLVRGINPCLVIPGHQNEMKHTIPHREEYTQDYQRMFGLNYPYVMMAWGESYLYTKPAELKGELPDRR